MEAGRIPQIIPQSFSQLTLLSTTLFSETLIHIAGPLEQSPYTPIKYSVRKSFFKKVNLFSILSAALCARGFPKAPEDSPADLLGEWPDVSYLSILDWSSGEDGCPGIFTSYELQ